MTKTKKITSLYKASQISDYFIYLASQPISGGTDEIEGISNLKLQKMLYFAQAYFLSKINKALFSDKIEAWEYGPVVPEIYHKYKRHGRNSIILISTNNDISEKHKEIIKEVWVAFGGYSARKLVDISHSHSPWKDAYKSHKKEISVKSIQLYYKPLLTR